MALPALTRSPDRPTTAALAVWAALIATAAAWGASLAHTGTRLFLPSPPLFARLAPHLDLGLLPAVAFAAGIVAAGPAIAHRLPWRWLLIVAAFAVGVWVVLLGAANGWGILTTPFRAPDQYPHDVAAVHAAGSFLAHFVADLPRYTTHVRSHPPGFLLLVLGLSRLGLDGAVAATALAVGGAALVAPAALVALREVAGEDKARAVAPFLVLVPAAVLVTGSADALFAGVAASAIALFVVATGRRDRVGDAGAGAAGLLFGMGLFLSYGLVVLAAVPAAVALARRRARPALIAVAAVAATVLAFAAAGFWWLAGLRATETQYWAGVASTRPYRYFLLADLAAFAVALGPAVAGGMARLGDRRVWLLVGGALVAVALADLSGLSKAETERIWLPFAPWLLVATCALARPRRWLAAQAAVALALQAGFHFPW